MVIAPGRAHRPGGGFALIEPETQAERDECPFCRGREDRTPPETRRLPEGAAEWTVRMVPNLYPAVEGQEVIVHSPHHVRTFAELTDEEVGFIADIVSSTDAFWLVNEGRAAGSSLPHSHSQLASVEPPAENAVSVRDVLALDELLVAERDGVRAVAHPAGRLPYELLLGVERVRPALLLLRECISRLRNLEGPVPWNAWLHRGPVPHLEVVPRLTVLAGLELGAGIYVNSLDPAEAAARLRSTGATPPGPAQA